MKKKYLGIVAMLAAVMLVFAACGSDSSSADKANGSTKGDKEVSGSLTA
ncbi:phosphate ABC transporter substrate-binding protein, partial [Listeria monocytogenes]